MANRPAREYLRQQVGGADPHEGQERDQCGYCGAWYTPGPADLSGVCPADRPQAHTEISAGLP